MGKPLNTVYKPFKPKNIDSNNQSTPNPEKSNYDEDVSHPIPRDLSEDFKKAADVSDSSNPTHISIPKIPQTLNVESSNIITKLHPIFRFFRSLFSSVKKRFLIRFLSNNGAEIHVGNKRLLTGIPLWFTSGSITGISAFMLLTSTTFGLTFLTPPIILTVGISSLCFFAISSATNISAILDKISISKRENNDPLQEVTINVLSKIDINEINFDMQKAKQEQDAFIDKLCEFQIKKDAHIDL